MIHITNNIANNLLLTLNTKLLYEIVTKQKNILITTTNNILFFRNKSQKKEITPIKRSTTLIKPFFHNKMCSNTKFSLRINFKVRDKRRVNQAGRCLWMLISIMQKNALAYS
ncbi:hypothetical protein A9264_12175 [Vibrio sp. UCD-FRSSP16_10]|nr:hypothetical protein A9260_12390 [Vibrio sp. UCD-FRSSP16_30]OBT21096.1 hypothetical protein A9264_12175 [Vibrio sp. UCD-FRSSP16_10]